LEHFARDVRIAMATCENSHIAAGDCNRWIELKERWIELKASVMTQIILNRRRGMTGDCGGKEAREKKLQENTVEEFSDAASGVDFLPFSADEGGPAQPATSTTDARETQPWHPVLLEAMAAGIADRPYDRGRKRGKYCTLCQRWADEPHLRGRKRARLADEVTAVAKAASPASSASAAPAVAKAATPATAALEARSVAKATAPAAKATAPAEGGACVALRDAGDG